MLTRNAKGVFVIAPTPFLPDGALDLASADRMTDAFLAAGARVAVNGRSEESTHSAVATLSTEAFACPGDIAKAVAAFETFKNPYQAAVDQPQPLFRRRAA